MERRKFLFGLTAVAAWRVQDLKEVELIVEGMSWEACSATVVAVLKKAEGVKEARADHEKARGWVKYDPAKTSPEKLVEAINKQTNFTARLP